MSDVSNPSSPTSPVATSAPSPPQLEVPVNEAPVGSPSPIGEQAPPKPPGQEINKSSHVGRREAIQNAFAKAKEAQTEAQKTAAEKPKPKVDAKAAERPQPHREAGRFARDPSKQQPDQQQPQPGQQPQQQQRPQLDQNARFRDPLPRFSEQAKSEWGGTPESVRGAVHQMAREFQGAYEKYRGDHEVMNEVRPFHDLAVKQGTSLARAFQNYYGMEMKLRQDLIGGLDVIVNNLKMRASDGSPITLRDVAYHIMNMSPEQHRLTAQQNQQTSADMRIGQLHQMVEQLSQGIGQMQYQQRYSQTRSQVDQFADTHPRFDELADLIKVELDHGYPLEVAYKRADMLRPNPHAAQTRTQSAQTRKTSISGAPDGSGNTRPSDGRRSANGEAVKHPTRREAIAKAMRRVGNGL